MSHRTKTDFPTTDASTAWRKRTELCREEEVTLKRFKRLKIDEEHHDDSEAPDNMEKTDKSPCQALVPYFVAPAESAFKLAICTDYPESFLGKRLLALDASNLKIDNDKVNRESCQKEHERQLVVYQPPLSELLKEAAYLEEHRMQVE